MACNSCGFFFNGKICPSCGTERKGPSSNVLKLSGEMYEFNLQRGSDWKSNSHQVWEQICWIAIDRKGQSQAAEMFAMAQYRNIYGRWPSWSFETTHPKYPSRELQNHVKAQLIRYWKARGGRKAV